MKRPAFFALKLLPKKPICVFFRFCFFQGFQIASGFGFNNHFGGEGSYIGVVKVKRYIFLRGEGYIFTWNSNKKGARAVATLASFFLTCKH